MPLSDLNSAFDDLSTDGITGAHASGFTVLVTRGPHLRVGMETLVGNADLTAPTTMSFQGAGLAVDLATEGRWFAAAGLGLGGIIVHAGAHADDSDNAFLHTGTWYKGASLYASPVLAVGTRIGLHEVRLIIRRVELLDIQDRIDSFSATYCGIGYAWAF